MIQGKWIDCKCAIPEYQMKLYQDEQNETQNKDFQAFPRKDNDFFNSPMPPPPAPLKPFIPKFIPAKQEERPNFFNDSFAQFDKIHLNDEFKGQVTSQE